MKLENYSVVEEVKVELHVLKCGEILNSAGDAVGPLKGNFYFHLNCSGDDGRFGGSELILFAAVTVVSKLLWGMVVEVD